LNLIKDDKRLKRQFQSDSFRMHLKFDLENIENAAGELLRLFPEARIFAFYGTMGAGKTTFIKSICRLEGIEENVTSPTFSLVNEYHGNHGKVIFHFDFYRIDSLEEVLDIGYEDYFYSGNMCLIEWPEKIRGLLPEESLRVKLDVLDTGERLLRILKDD
jgi:tRNA threonylcarbamoyladenosine biosynthesis protein TsaE